MRVKTYLKAACTCLLLGVTALHPVSGADEGAVLTEAHGAVFKRTFIDVLRRIFGDPTPARVNDRLHDGTQMGTGDNSWAQITWPEVVTRTWANTVVQLMPNKRIVYLAGGEMLFRLKKERNTSDYSIWTKVLQARVRGTTVLVQSAPCLTRLTVLEGFVEAKNLLDGSEIRLGPGAVYEVLTKPCKRNSPEADSQNSGTNGGATSGTESGDGRTNTTSGGATPWDAGFAPNGSPSAATENGKTDDWQPDLKSLKESENDICDEKIPPVELFKTANCASSLRVANPETLANHPLLKAFAALDSAERIKSAMHCLEPIKAATNVLAERNRLLSKSVEVLSGPVTRDAKVGKELGYRFSMPSLAAGAKPERLPLPNRKSSSQPLSAGTIAGGGAAALAAPSSLPPSSKAQQIAELQRQYEDACRKANEFRESAMREKQMRTERLKGECEGLPPQECEYRKSQLNQWEREQMQKMQSMQNSASEIKSRIDLLRAFH
ncbi:MAG TPA: FecR domain-containing protein [Candidatus Obscuribacterales bacterium]